MASVPALLFLNLAFSMGFLMNLKPLLTFLHNCNISPIYLMSIHTFFFLFLLTLDLDFLSAVILLILHLSIPNSNSAYTKQLTTAARVLTFATLLFMAVLLSMFVLSGDHVIPDSIKTTFAAATMMIAYISYVRSSLNLFSCLTPGYVPVCFALCISMATLYLTEQSPSLVYHGHANSLSNILIHLALFGNFILAIVLLFLRAASDMQPRLITAVKVERIAKTAVTTSIIVILIGVYMTVAVQIGIESSFV